jgi:hypothetical protein
VICVNEGRAMAKYINECLDKDEDSEAIEALETMWYELSPEGKNILEQVMDVVI